MLGTVSGSWNLWVPLHTMGLLVGLMYVYVQYILETPDTRPLQYPTGSSHAIVPHHLRSSAQKYRTRPVPQAASVWRHRPKVPRSIGLFGSLALRRSPPDPAWIFLIFCLTERTFPSPPFNLFLFLSYAFPCVFVRVSPCSLIALAANSYGRRQALTSLLLSLVPEF